MKKIILIIFTTLPLVFLNTCIMFNIGSDYKEQIGYYRNNSSHNIFIQEFYFYEIDNSGRKIFYDYGTTVNKKTEVDAAPTNHSIYLEKIVFIDIDTCKYLRTISSAEYFHILKLIDTKELRNKSGGKTTYYKYQFKITDEFLNPAYN